jgi:hypothetical protein
MAHAGGSCDPALAQAETRLTLTTTPEPPDDRTSKEPASEPGATPAAEPAPGPTTPPDPEPEAESEPADEGESSAPGVGEAIGGVRAAFMRLLDAHITLLRAELQITGRELGIILGLAFGAFVIAVLAGILLYVGSFLFFGELLFGSMGWGIIHGTLLAATFIGFVAVNLAGGRTDRYAWGAAIGVVVAIILAAVMLTNVGNSVGGSIADWVSDTFTTEDLPFGEAWLVTLGGLVLGGLVALIVAAIIGWRANLRDRRLLAVSAVGLVVGGFVGALWMSTRYAAPDGVLGLAITIGFLTWIIAGLGLAVRAGFDTEARYANLVPRESIAAFETTKAFMIEQWERQKDRMLGR